MNLPEGTKPMEIKKNANGLYCSSWHMPYCWAYDEQARTLTYEGPLYKDGYVFAELEHIDQPYYLDADKTQVNYHEVTASITANPDSAYAQEYGPHTVSIGWTPSIHEIVPTSQFTA